MRSIIYKPDLSGTRFYDIKWNMINENSIQNYVTFGSLREKRNNTKERNTPKYL